MDNPNSRTQRLHITYYIISAITLLILIYVCLSESQTSLAFMPNIKPGDSQNILAINSSLYTDTLFFDDFSGDLSNWVVQYGEWHIDQDILVGDAGQYPNFASIYTGEPTWTDYIFQTSVVTETLDTVLILRSLIPGQTEYRVEFWWEESPFFTNSYYVYKYQDGIFEELSDGFKHATVPITSESTLKVQISGNHILLYIDDHYIDDIIDENPIPNGQIGLGVLWDTASFDDVLVSTVPPAMIYPVEDEKYSYPGKPITYTFEVANYLGYEDSFDLEILPGANWTTTLSTDSLGPINNGESASFMAFVDIPQDALPGDQSSAIIQATSVTSPTVFTTSIITTTAVSNEITYVLAQDSLILVDRITQLPIQFINLTQYGCMYAEIVKLTPDLSQVYVTCFQDQKIIIFNSSDNSYVAEINLPYQGNLGDITFSRDGSIAVVGVTDSHYVSLIDTSTYTVINNINSVYPRTLTTHPYLPYVYIGGYLNYGPDYIQLLNTNTFEIDKTIMLETEIYDIQPSPDGMWIYVVGEWNNIGQLYKLDVNTNTVVDSLSGWNRLIDIKIIPDGSKLFVRETGNFFHVIDGIQLTEITSFLYENANTGMELSCDGSELWIDTQHEDMPVFNTNDYSLLYYIHIPDSGTNSIAMCSPITHGVFAHKLADDRYVSPGELFNFNLSLYNYDSINLDNIIITDTLPLSLIYKDGSLSATSGDYNYDNGVITWTGSISAGNSVDVNFGTTVLQSIDLGTTITNTAVFSTPTNTYLRNEVLEIVPYQILLPCVAKPCSPIYFDNFSNPSSGWPIAEDQVAKLGYIDGEYQILVKEAYWLVFAAKDFTETEFRVEVDTWPETKLSGATGLIYGMTDNEFYSFEISNGYYSVIRYFNDGSWYIVFDWTYSNAIHTGHAINHLKVVQNQLGTFLYANDTLLNSYNVTNNMGTRLGMISEAFSNDFDGRFDNFTVYVGKCIYTLSDGSTLINNLTNQDFWFEEIPRIQPQWPYRTRQ